MKTLFTEHPETLQTPSKGIRPIFKCVIVSLDPGSFSKVICMGHEEDKGSTFEDF